MTKRKSPPAPKAPPPAEPFLGPSAAALLIFQKVRTAERDALLRTLFPEGFGPLQQERVVARIRRHFPEVPREDLRKMNPGDLAVYLRGVLDAEQKAAGLVLPACEGYPPGALQTMAGLGRTAVLQYAKAAGVQTPGRGQRNYHYPPADARKILAWIASATTEDRVRNRCNAALQALPIIPS